jgi:translocation protein SEC66
VLRERLDEIQAQTEHDKEWWEKRRASIQTEFMKELDEEKPKGAASAMSEDEPVMVESTPSAAPSKKKKGKK